MYVATNSYKLAATFRFVPSLRFNFFVSDYYARRSNLNVNPVHQKTFMRQIVYVQYPAKLAVSLSR